jgi:enterobacterial common antigen flippase
LTGQEDNQRQATQHYRVALKAGSITGGSQAIVLLTRLINAKAIALILGPAGVGAFGLLSGLMSLIGSFADLGMRSSGVRQIAVAAADGDLHRTARVVKIMRGAMLLLGLTVATTVVLFREPIARVAMGNADHVTWMLVIAGAVVFASINDGQRILLRGMRRVADLAKGNILASIGTVLVSLPLVLLFGMDGVAWAILISACVGAYVFRQYARRIELPAATVSLPDAKSVLRSMLQLGLVFMVTGLVATGTVFAMKAMVVHAIGLEGAGQFQAASTLSMVYVGFILQAMAQDFYPRLTAVQSDNQQMTRLVNEQVELSLLLAVPGLLITTAASPWIITLLYSDEFMPAAEILRWQCFGVLLRVASAPLAYILMAKGASKAILATEVATNLFHVAVFWWLLQAFGLKGVGFGLPATYIFYVILILLIVRRAYGHRISVFSRRIMLLSGAAFLVTFGAIKLLPAPLGILSGCLVAVAAGAYSYRALERLTAIPLARAVLSKARRLVGRRSTP